MTRGALIFAFNNEHIDYVAMAAWSARNIHRHLGIPVCVVTDSDSIRTDYEFDQVIAAAPQGSNWRNFGDIPQPCTWYNGNRVDAYALSPWDQTLVLDADYVVASDQLSCLWQVDQDFLAHRWAWEVTGVDGFEQNNFFGLHRMPMSWATVMMFRRSHQAELMFGCMNMIRANWDHYRHLYGVTTSTYRNDIALSIAMSIMDGHTLTWPTIPWPLTSVNTSHKVTQLSQDQYRVEYSNSRSQTRWITLQQDFHAMGKRHLGEIVAANL
jgi:hypothetical protein